MNRSRIEGLVRQAQQAPRTARPNVDLVPGDQRSGNERTAVLPQNAPGRPAPSIPARGPTLSGGFSRQPPPGPGQTYSRAPAPAPGQSYSRVPPEQRMPEQRMPEQRMPEQRMPEQRMPSERPAERRPPESIGAIALPRPPVQQPVGIISRPPPAGTQRAQNPPPIGAPRTVRHTQNPNPQSAAPVPALDDLVPQRRSDRPGFGRAPSVRPPVSHRSNPPRERPRFADRTPDPRPPGYGLPQPDSLGRLPAPRYDSPADFAPLTLPGPGPEETMAMRHGPYAGNPTPAEYYPPPQQQRSTSAFPQHFAPAPAPPLETVRDSRDQQEYYPHLHAQQMQMQHHPSTQPLPPLQPRQQQHPSAYPPAMNPMHPMHLHPGAAQMQGRTMPPSAPVSVRIPTPIPPMPGMAFPAMAPALEAPSFFGLVLFAAPLAIGTLAVAALALL